MNRKPGLWQTALKVFYCCFIFCLMLPVDSAFACINTGHASLLDTLAKNRQLLTGAAGPAFMPPVVNAKMSVLDIAGFGHNDFDESNVDMPAYFRGREGEFDYFLLQATRYPQADWAAGVEGTVALGFFVEADGTLSDIKALKGPSKSLNAEAVRLIALSPQWQPAMQNGKPVRTPQHLLLKFMLDGATNKPTAALAVKPKCIADRDIPQFPGGDEAMDHFISINLKYPQTDQEAGRQGKVNLYFEVDADGTVSNITALHGPSEAMKKEAMRVMSLSPKWAPAYLNDKPVKTAYNMPIIFKLDY